MRNPGLALDEFVLGMIKLVQRGDHATTAQSADAFVKSILVPAKAAEGVKQIPDAKREMELLNRQDAIAVFIRSTLTTVT